MDNKLLKVVTDLYLVIDEMSWGIYLEKEIYRGSQCPKCYEYDGIHLASCFFSKLMKIGEALRDLEHELEEKSECHRAAFP